MIYFEDARLEFFGMPLAYLPYFSAPDPTVKRKTGFLMPIDHVELELRRRRSKCPTTGRWRRTTTSRFAPMITTKQGPLLQGEFRQRLINGAYHDPRRRHLSARQGRLRAQRRHRRRPAIATCRGSVETSGQFALNDKWVWGWDGVLLTDKTFLPGLQPASVALSRHRSVQNRR